MTRKPTVGTALPRTLQPVSGAGAAIVDGRLIVVGGEGVTSVSGTVQAYDLTAPTATWTTLPSLTQGRHGLGVTAIGNTLYAVGGATKAGHTASTNLVAALAVPARRAHAAAAWRPRHEMAVAVQQVNATVLDGRIWVAGGLTPSHEATASTQFYDPVINSWELGPPLPEPVHHAMLVNYRDQLAVIGGFHSRDNDPLAVTSPRMLLLDNNTGKWVDGPPLRHPRAAGGAAVVDDKIVVVGGRVGNPEQLVTQTEVYDGTRWRDAADILVARRPPRRHRRLQLPLRRRRPQVQPPAATPTSCNAMTRKPTVGTSCPPHCNRSAAPAPPSSTADSSSSAAKGSPASPAPSRPTT